MRRLLWAMTALCGALTACLPPPMGAPPTPLAVGEVELGAGGLYEHHLAERPGELLCASMTPSCGGPSGVYWARMRPMLHRSMELGVTMSAGYTPTMLLYDGPASMAAAGTLRLWAVEEPQRSIGLELQLTPSWVTLGASQPLAAHREGARGPQLHHGVEPRGER